MAVARIPEALQARLWRPSIHAPGRAEGELTLGPLSRTAAEALAWLDAELDRRGPVSDPEGRRKRKRRESLKRLVSSLTHVALTTPTAFLDDEPEARQRTTARARKTIARLLDRPDRADDAVETAVREAFPELWTSLERAARGGRHGPGSRAVARWIARTILNVPEHELDAMNRRRREHRQPS